MEDPIRVSVNGADVYFVDVVRGLKSEADRVKDAIRKTKPEILAMSVSSEEIAGLKEYAKDPHEVEMSRYEELYARNLARFGDVFLPPPCFLAGIEAAENDGVEIVGIDMDDGSHTEAYCALVSGGELFRHTIRFNFLRLRSFRAGTPEEFVKLWDRRVNNLRGFRELERERERHMAEGLRRLSSAGRRMMAIVDAERAEQVRRSLVKE
jgi:hypothetical protein